MSKSFEILATAVNGKVELRHEFAGIGLNGHYHDEQWIAHVRIGGAWCGKIYSTEKDARAHFDKSAVREKRLEKEHKARDEAITKEAIEKFERNR